jgi:hypothetical protein
MCRLFVGVLDRNVETEAGGLIDRSRSGSPGKGPQHHHGLREREVGDEVQCALCHLPEQPGVARHRLGLAVLQGLSHQPPQAGHHVVVAEPQNLPAKSVGISWARGGPPPSSSSCRTGGRQTDGSIG